MCSRSLPGQRVPTGTRTCPGHPQPALSPPWSNTGPVRGSHPLFSNDFFCYRREYLSYLFRIKFACVICSTNINWILSDTTYIIYIKLPLHSNEKKNGVGVYQKIFLKYHYCLHVKRDMLQIKCFYYYKICYMLCPIS